MSELSNWLKDEAINELASCRPNTANKLKEAADEIERLQGILDRCLMDAEGEPLNPGKTYYWLGNGKIRHGAMVMIESVGPPTMFWCWWAGSKMSYFKTEEAARVNSKTKADDE